MWDCDAKRMKKVSDALMSLARACTAVARRAETATAHCVPAPLSRLCPESILSNFEPFPSLYEVKGLRFCRETRERERERERERDSEKVRRRSKRKSGEDKSQKGFYT